MSMSQSDFILQCDQWMTAEGPMHHSIVSSRARYARNLERIPFAPRARSPQLRAVLERVDEAISASSYFSDFRRLSIGDINSLQRLFMKESHLLSPELEQGGEHRVIYVSPDYRVSIMINEEDHLRIQCLAVGLQLHKVLAIVDEVEAELARHLQFARSIQFGYLAACPTNVGTGLRLSAMLHLPGLVLIGRMDEIVQSVTQYGLTVRGIYGENSENLGDYYQISNEVTLGKRSEEILTTLESVAEQVVEREMAARNALFEQKPLVVRDLLSRALAVLQHAHIIDSAEAMNHLSKIRLGIDRGHFQPVRHTDLSRLMVEVQPAHLQFRKGGQIPVERRDNLRAEMLHRRLRNVAYN
ncbi:ATP--guanido phosphotransferase [Candidatus Sumerlaeota bacterium]|nr:ATP--guanido phosphotransferase [Candidatus Sumerlaeota bacterium]